MSETLKNINKVKFLQVDESRYVEDWHSFSHSHPFAELFYVVHGSGTFILRDNTYYDLKADDLIIVNPNILHNEMSDAEDTLKYLVVGLGNIEFNIPESEFGFSVMNYSENKDDILPYLELMLNENLNPDEFSETVIDNAMRTMLINLTRKTSTLITPNDDAPRVNNDCIFIENYINAHFKEQITLDDLASLTFMNKYYLSHIFKEHTGYAPIEYLLNKRISEAERLLKTTTLSISQISGIVGFGTASYFFQYFKQINNMTASKYRKLHEEEDH